MPEALPQNAEDSPAQQRPVLHLLSGDLWGGSEAQMLMQLCALQQAGAQVKVVFFNQGITSERFQAEGLSCVFAEEKYGSARCFRVLKNHIRSSCPKLLVSHGYKEHILFGLCSVLFGLPWIAVFHGVREKFTGFRSLKARCYYFLSENFARFRACRIICVSQSLAKHLGFQADSRLRIIHNVVFASNQFATLSQNSKKSPQDLLPLSHPNGKRLIFIGRLVGVKRVDLLLRSFAKLEDQNAELFIVGDGPMRTQLEEQARSLGISSSAHFLGFRNNTDQLLAASDMFVLCSDGEGIPTVLLEAIAAEKPIVTTAVGGIPEVLDAFPDYPATLIPPDNQTALTEAIARMLNSPPAPSSNVQHILKKQFSPDYAAQQHREIYQDILREEEP